MIVRKNFSSCHAAEIETIQFSRRLHIASHKYCRDNAKKLRRRKKKNNNDDNSERKKRLNNF